jgi:hypothetical protein
MSNPSKHQIAHAMSKYGGGFAQAIAESWFRADSSNRAKLEEAFDELFQRYAEFAEEEGGIEL